jgi:hypothetical protein
MANGSGEGAKAFGGIMAIFGVIGGVAALMLPLNNRLSSVERLVNTHVEKEDHPGRQTTGIERAQEDIKEISYRMLQDDDRERKNTAMLAALKAEEIADAKLETKLIEALENRVEQLDSRLRAMEAEKHDLP